MTKIFKEENSASIRPDRKKKDFKQLKLVGLIVLALIALGVLWWPRNNGFNQFRPQQTLPVPEVFSVVSPSVPPVNAAVAEAVGGLEEVQASLAALTARLEALEKERAVAVSPVPAPSAKTSASGSVQFAPQTFYLGSGSTTQREWTESGAQAWFNSGDYPDGVNAVFEAGLSIVGGEAWARLKNKTTGAILSVTEIFNNNSTVTWKRSGSFKLHPGNNLYVVEIKSSSNETANLAGSRINLN